MAGSVTALIAARGAAATMVRGTLHVGVMAKLLGKRELELY